MSSFSPAPGMSGNDGPSTLRPVPSDRELWLVAGVTAGLALGVFAFTHDAAVFGPAMQPFQVDVNEVDGRVRLTWNPDLPQIKAATSGTLEVRAGDKSDSYPIEGKILRQGSLDHVLTDDDMLLSVRLLDKNEKSGPQSVVRVVAPVVAEISMPSAAQPQLAARARVADHSTEVAKTKKVGKTKKVAKSKKPSKKHSRAR